MRSLTKRDILFLALLSGCFFACGGLLARDVLMAGRVRGGEQVGVITYKNRYAEQKVSGSALWASLSQNGPVFNRDTIRTGPESTAIIYLNDKTVINLEEESMVYINVSKTSSRISLAGGSVEVGNTGGGKAVTLETASGEVQLTKGSLMARENPGGEVSLRARQGTAEIRTTGEAVSLSPETVLNLATQDLSEAEFVPLGPSVDSVLVVSETPSPIDFTWKGAVTGGGTGEAGEPVELLVSRDPSFDRPLVRERDPASGISVPLAEGRYFWKLSSSPDSIPFRVVRGRAPEPASPVSRDFVTSASRPVNVSFSWSRAGEADLFRIDVWKSGEADKPFISTEVNQRKVSLEIPGTGDFTWTATALVGPERVPFTSSPATFSIRDGSPPAPVVETAPISGLALENGRAAASWPAVEGADRYEVILSRDPAANDVVMETSAPANFLTLTDPPESGTYYLSVRSVSGDLASPWSPPAPVDIVKTEPIVPLAPANGAVVVLAEGETLAFSWKDRNYAGNYRLVASRSEDLSNPFVDETVQRERLSAKIPGDVSGPLFWKVTAVGKSASANTPAGTAGIAADATEASTARSPVIPFRIARPLEPPKPVSPVRGKQFDINSMKALVLEWERQDRPYLYTVRLFRMTAGIPGLLGEWSTEDNRIEIKDLSLLAIDTFAWELSSVERTEGEDGEISAPITSYFKIVQKKPLAIPKIRTMKVKGVF